MMQNITQRLKATVAALVVGLGLAGVSLALPVVALAAPDTTSVCQGVSLTGGTCDPDQNQFQKVLKLVINIISFIAGFAAVIMIIVGGIKYVTSGGDSSATASAKNTIIYAIVGLVVVAMAQIIVRFVLDKALK